MDKLRFLWLIPALLLLLCVQSYVCEGNSQDISSSEVLVEEKITGVNFTGPSKVLTENPFGSYEEVGAEWTSVIPYGFSHVGNPKVNYNIEWQWWGERKAGVVQLIAYAKEKGLKVMLKPQVWVINQGWPGEYTFNGSKTKWREWGESYEEYIMSMAHIADSMDVELFCIATEYKMAVKEYPSYWPKLIEKVRAIYDGELTYAANWDSYEAVKFWDKLDYIGVDAYFPLDDAKTPSVETLEKAWRRPASSIYTCHKKYKKPVLFTEYGYMSADYSTWKHWEINEDGLNTIPNMQVQVNGYEALYRTFWDKPWFAGGFLWKWHHYHDKAGGETHKSFTPQNKPVTKTIKAWYTKP